MIKIFRLSCFLIDKHHSFTKKDIEKYLSNVLFCSTRNLHVEEATVNPKDTKLLLDTNCDLAECQKYFDNEVSTISPDREVEIGATYRHFKGKEVTVIAIAQDSEVPGRYDVVYNCKAGCFHRPYDMFISEVDHVKYPDAKQKYRFEKVVKEDEVNLEK